MSKVINFLRMRVFFNNFLLTIIILLISVSTATSNVYAVIPELGIQLYKNGTAISENKYFIVQEDNKQIICEKGFCTVWGGKQTIRVYSTEKDLLIDQNIPNDINVNKIGFLSLSYENGGLDYDSGKKTGFIPYEKMGYYIIFDLDEGSVTPSLIPYSSTNNLDDKNFKYNTYLIIAFFLSLIVLLFLSTKFKKILKTGKKS